MDESGHDLIVETTDDGFLGGRLKLRQPRRGHRAGHDAILLAASTNAQPGQRIVDLGAGVGAAGLAVAARVPGLELTMVEIDPALADLAAYNAKTNGIAAQVATADVMTFSAELAAGTFDGVLMNPPFHDFRRHRVSGDVAKRLAHSASEQTLTQWVSAAHRLLKSQGVLTLIWRADELGDVLAAASPQFGGIHIQPVHASRDKPAVRILLRAVKGSNAPLMLFGAAILDGSDSEVEAAMRRSGRLPLANTPKTAKQC